jgi:hypothetical protein
MNIFQVVDCDVVTSKQMKNLSLISHCDSVIWMIHAPKPQKKIVSADIELLGYWVIDIMKCRTTKLFWVLYKR